MKRARRRQRGRDKSLANKQAKTLILDNWPLASDTWGGKYCPGCYRQVPFRFLETHRSEPINFIWDGMEVTAHLTFGGRCKRVHCVKNDARYPINKSFKKYTEKERGIN